MSNSRLPTLDFLPFGSQYYRAPTPASQDWERNLDQFHAAGFNTLKYWAQWRWNNPLPGEYDFSDLDRLMDLAAARGLRVVINTIFDVAPAWLYRQYPDCRLLTASGQRVDPSAPAHRQIGGAPGPCLNHPEARQLRMDFLSAVVRQYAKHPALWLWDLWNEPTLTCGVLGEPRSDNQVCYCEHCEEGFKQWLRDKVGTIDAVNARWGRRYASFDELELPRSLSTFGDIIDWRLYHVDSLTAEQRRRVEITKSLDTVHPTMCHTVPMPVSNPLASCADDWELAEVGDLHGNSLGSDPSSADLIRSAARGKTIINSEIHALPGSSLSRPRPVGMAELQRHIFIPLAHGAKGFLFWQYRPELLGGESPAWGLTNPDGTPTPWHEDARRINSALQDNASFLLAAEPEGCEVGIFYHPANHIFSWCCYDLGMHDQAVRGVYNTLHDNNFRVRFVHPLDLRKGIPSTCRAIIYPFPYVLDGETADALREWVRNGGRLIGEAFFGNLVRETSLHSQKVPGYGFDEVFGACEAQVVPFAETTALSSEGCRVSLFGPTMTTVSELPGMSAGYQAQGYRVQAPLSLSTACSLARFDDGSPAITMNTFGSGQAFLCGTLISHAAGRNMDSARLLAALVELAAPCCKTANTKDAVRIDVLSDGNLRGLIVQNLASSPVQASISLPDKEVHLPLRNPVTGQTVPCRAEGGGWSIHLEPLAVELFIEVA